MRASSILGYDDVRIANLCAMATPTVVELNTIDSASWKAARPGIQEALVGADGILAGWGIAGVSGPARRLLMDQVDWLHDEATTAGIGSVWMVGGQPRHPSRWHQYVSDKYGRTAGGTAAERLRQVLTAVPIDPPPELGRHRNDEDDSTQRGRQPDNNYSGFSTRLE